MERDPRATRRTMLRAAGVVAGVGLAGCSGTSGEDTPGEKTGGAPDQGSPSESSTPTSDPDPAALGVGDTTSTYAIIGSEDAVETARLYGSWKCPYTAQFVTEMLPPIADAYVEPGELSVEFRGVRYQDGEPYGGDEPRTLRAGLAVWDHYPERFPAYLKAVLSNQPSDTTEWATVDQLLVFARQAGIDETDPIQSDVEAGRFSDAWRDTMDLVGEKGIEGVPRFELADEITAPVLEPDATERQLARALE